MVGSAMFAMPRLAMSTKKTRHLQVRECSRSDRINKRREANKPNVHDNQCYDVCGVAGGCRGHCA